MIGEFRKTYNSNISFHMCTINVTVEVGSRGEHTSTTNGKASDTSILRESRNGRGEWGGGWI